MAQVRVGPQQLHGVRARPRVAAAAAPGSGSASTSSRRTRSERVRSGLRLSGVGSSHRSRNTVSTSWTAGPWIFTCTSCQGGCGPYSAESGCGCGSPRCSASSRRLWARSMPPTNATSRVGSSRWRTTTNFWWCEPPVRHPHVQQHLRAPALQPLAEVPVLGGEEAGLVEVRAPHQPPDVDTTLVGGAEHLLHLRAGLAGEPLVRVALPVGEEHQVARPGRGQHVVQLPEVRRPVDQRRDPVALRPRPVVRVLRRRGGCSGLPRSVAVSSQSRGSVTGPRMPPGRRCQCRYCSLPSSTVARPRRKVATTRPGSSIPAYGVLRESEADAEASTVRRTDGS